MEKTLKYDTIVIGLGASGLFFCAASGFARSKKKILVLERKDRAGIKLLMSGGGQCNFTHNGSIKEFLSCYGDNGHLIRHCLYRHNNLEMIDFIRGLDIDVFHRGDGKVFPKSLQSRDILSALLTECLKNQLHILYDHCVTKLILQERGFLVVSSDSSGQSETFYCDNLVIASGGCSYPTTGSDGRMFDLLSKELDIPLVTPRPALTPIHISDYPFSPISGVSLPGISMKIINGNSPSDKSFTKSEVRSFSGDLLFTHENLSGPLILNSSRYMRPGDVLEFNFTPSQDYHLVVSELKSSFQGNNKEVIPFISAKYSLPKSFVEILLRDGVFSHKKLSSLSGESINLLASRLTKCQYKVHHLSGFKKAMVTAGGVDLSAVDLKTMESKGYPGMFFIGEVLDVDGDTGGYNLQFAYSSAMTARDCIEK